MRKWPWFFIVSFSGLSLCVPALASDENAPLSPPAAATLCLPLVQKGNAIPPLVTDNLQTLKLCMNNCGAIYQPLGDQGRTEEMLRNSNECRKSLNNLYFSSVAQTIAGQLNQQTQQQHATEQASTFEHITAIMTQHQQDQAAANPAAEEPADNTNTNTNSNASAPTQPANNQIVGPPEGVNW